MNFKRYPMVAGSKNSALQMDLNGTIVGAGGSIDQIFGYKNSELLGKKIEHILPPFEHSRMTRFLENICENQGNIFVAEHWDLTWLGKEGNELELICSSHVLRQKFDSYLILFLSLPPSSVPDNFSDEHCHDPITNLPNRYLFNDRLELSVAHSERHKEILAVMILDLRLIDGLHFSFPSPLKELALKEAAIRICSCVRADDTICRFEEDKFAVIFPQIKSEESATYLAQKILETFKNPLFIDGNQMRISPLIGIAIYPNDGRSPQSLLDKAEMALTQTRREGKNDFGFYNVDLHKAALHRRSMESALRSAINNEELTVYFQPKLALEEMRICGMEALVRWNRPGFGLVGPDDFIPVAEDTGLILDIGQWVLREACLQGKRWQEELMNSVSISVNLSMKQFKDQNLVDMILETLRETGLPSQCLELEVTESVLMEDAEGTIKTIKRLHEIGVRTGMDDFGTGYSSLSYISKLPFQFIKIDKSFVKNVDQRANRSIIKAIVDMAKVLRLETVVEGIETESQLEICSILGCDQAQDIILNAPFRLINWMD